MLTHKYWTIYSKCRLFNCISQDECRSYVEMTDFSGNAHLIVNPGKKCQKLSSTNFHQSCKSSIVSVWFRRHTSARLLPFSLPSHTPLFACPGPSKTSRASVRAFLRYDRKPQLRLNVQYISWTWGWKICHLVSTDLYYNKLPFHLNQIVTVDSIILDYVLQYICSS